jgi:predicted SAM-dependent methyltransferase
MPRALRERLKRFRPLRSAYRALQSGMTRVRRYLGLPLRPILVARYLARHREPRLQLGAGAVRLPGWLNTDGFPLSLAIVSVDAGRPLPFADGTFMHVFSEHHIEHMPYRVGQAMLRECHRVLAPRGRIRIATPDLDTLLRLHSKPRSPEQEAYVRWITDTWMPELGGTYSDVLVINHAFRAWGHQCLYDEATLRASLEAAGFADVRRHPPGESDDPHFRGLESHGDAVGNLALNRFETMVLEATRR